MCKVRVKCKVLHLGKNEKSALLSCLSIVAEGNAFKQLTCLGATVYTLLGKKPTRSF